MLNQSIVVGRLTNDAELKELENGKKVCNIQLAIPRSYKNENGEYDTDFIDCTLWGNMAENITSYCQKGDLLGVKGRLETKLYEKDGKSHKSMKLIAEKITFLSSKVKEKEDEIEV